MKKSWLALSVCLFGAFCFSPDAFAKPHHKGPEHIQKFGNHHKMKDGAKFGLKNGLKDGFKDGWKGHKRIIAIFQNGQKERLILNKSLLVILKIVQMEIENSGTENIHM